METNDQGPSGNVKDDKADLKLGLTIGIPAAALLIAIIATIVVLLKTGKLKCCCANRHKRSKEDFAQREERKKSIIIIAPTGKRGSELYIARHFYEAEDDNQLNLETGRIVEVQEKLDNGWWRGVTGGKEGWFPATFVKKIDVSDPNSSMHSLSSAVSSTPGSTRRPPPPTSKPPVDNEVSASADIYVNSAFELDNSDADCQRREYSQDSYLYSETDCNKTSKSITDKTDKDEHQVIIDNDIDNKLDVMKSEDIEGYLNDIFSVEEETPEAPRKNKLHLSKHSRDCAYQDGNKKRMKDEQNKSLLKEPLQIADAKMKMPNKKCHSKKLKGSPLINPEHYMISSSESLFSVSSCNEGGDTGDEQQVVTSQSKEEDAERVYGDPDGGQTSRNHDVHRGAPDGSSLVGILPDGQKEFSLERDFINEEDLNINIYTEDELPENVSSSFTPEKNVQNRMISVSTVDKPVFVVIYPFTPIEPNQLTLARNELVYSLGQEENGWMKGEKKHTGETGWFPISYVREGKPPLTSDILSEESEALDSDGEFEEDDNMTYLECRALYPYKAQQEGDLTLNVGDIIIVTESHDNGWWRGCLGKQEGWFPGTYVEPVPQTPASSSVYEDVGFPVKMVAPLSTNSLADDKNEKQSTAEIEESILSGLRTDNLGSSGRQPASTEDKNNSLSPVNITFKPHVPRRFVKPKLVTLPKERKNSMKALKKPSRPPPPVPKVCGSIYNNEGNVTSEGHSMDMNDDVSVKFETALVDSIEQKRKSLPRPKEPPPPAPAVSAIIFKDNALSVETSKIDMSSSNANGNMPMFSQSEQNKDYEDVEPRLQLALSDTQRNVLDSCLGIDINIRGVHTSARQEHTDKSKTASSGSPELVIGSNLLDSMDYDKSGTNTWHEKNLNPKSFNAILGIFKRIVQREDPSVISDGPILSGEDSLVMTIKPALPPKPATYKANFRRSLSEPDLLGLTMTSRSKLCDVSLTTDHVDGAAVSGSSRASDKVRSAASKPALPPRPKMPPHRSQSVGSLVLVKGAEELISTGEIKKTEVVNGEVNQKHDIHAKPEKPPPPSVVMKVNMDKKQFSVDHKGADVDVKNPASAADVTHIDSAKHFAEQGTLRCQQIKANASLSNMKMKLETSMEKEQILYPPRPVEPPGKSFSVPVNNNIAFPMDKHVKVQKSFAAAVKKHPINLTSISVATQFDSQGSPLGSKPITVISKNTSTCVTAATTHAEKPSLIHDKTPIALLNSDQSVNRKTRILDGDRGQRQNILSNGSLKISVSPEGGVEYHHSLLGNRVDESTVQDLSVPSLPMEHSDVAVNNYPSQPLPTPLPSYPPLGSITTKEKDSGTGSKTRESSESYQTDGSQNQEITASDGRTLRTPMNIQTSCLRFFTPVGFSRSFISSNVCSSDITISSAKPSPAGSLSSNGSIELATQKANTVSLDSKRSFADEGQKSSSSMSVKKNNSFQFYTPVSFISNQNDLSIDDVSHEQTYISSSEQNLCTQPRDDRPERFGSTDSLDRSGSKYSQLYASVDLKPTVKRTLTPPKPFLPSRGSAYPVLQKGIMSLAMVDIDIDDASNTATEDTKMVNKGTEGFTEVASNRSSLLMISQADLESDV